MTYSTNKQYLNWIVVLVSAMKFYFFLPSFFILCFYAAIHGQSRIELKAAYGVSKISNTYAKLVNSIKIKTAPSWSGGIVFKTCLKNKSIFGTELLFSQIKGKEKLEFQSTDFNGTLNSDIKSVAYKQIYYLSLPIFYEYSFTPKIAANVGFQTSIALAALWKENGSIDYYNGDVIEWEYHYQAMNIKRWDIGLRAGVSYQITENLSIEGLFYYGINNINGSSLQKDFRWSIRQATLGVRYSIVKNEKEKTEVMEGVTFE